MGSSLGYETSLGVEIRQQQVNNPLLPVIFSQQNFYSSDFNQESEHNELMKTSVPHYHLYGESQSTAESEFLHVETISERSSAHEWEIAPHRHDNLFQMIWVDRGRIKIAVESTVELCYGPAIMIVPPGVVHGFSINQGTTGLVFTIADAFMHRVFDDGDQNDLGYLFIQPRLVTIDTNNAVGSALLGVIKQLDEEYRWPKPARLQFMDALLKTLFVHLARLIPKIEKTAGVERDVIDQFHRFQKLLEHHFRERWKVQQYCESLAVSEKRLARYCKAAVDLTPLQLIHNRVLTEAKRQLVYTRMSITEIALDLNFVDPAYFSKFFHKATGQSPTEFRRN